MPSVKGASHVALTVRDMEASAQWYQRIFGCIELRRFTGEEAGTPRILLYHPESGFAVGLCQPEDGTTEPFDHRRTGLDHFAFLVGERAELDAWAAYLDEQGVAHSPVRETVLGWFVSFEDPDGIAFEVWANRV
jgi:glyoxylase I family protein